MSVSYSRGLSDPSYQDTLSDFCFNLSPLVACSQLKKFSESSYGIKSKGMATLTIAKIERLENFPLTCTLFEVTVTTFTLHEVI